VLAWVHLTNARIALSERHLSEAKTKAQAALDLAGAQIKELEVQAKYVIGLANAFSGANQLARKLCEEAVTKAKEVNSPRLMSSALLAFAEILILANDGPAAKTSALQAQATFERAGELDSEWRAWLLAARASELAGDKSAMKEYAARADSRCEGLQQKWGKDAYDGYLQRPDIRSYRNDLAQILTRSK